MSDQRWHDLRKEIEEDFAAHARPVDAKYVFEIGLCLRRQTCRTSSSTYKEQRRWSIRKQRLLQAASRPPCPYCGKKVTRTSKNGHGSEPIYCSRACMKRAAAMRWWNKDKKRANDLRRQRRKRARVKNEKTAS